MNWIALKMLTGERGKYLGIVLGIAFSSLLITQQASIFCGVMALTVGTLRDIDDAQIWVMDPAVEYLDAPRPMSDNDLFRVRSAGGVDWAVRLYKSRSRGRLFNGEFQQINLIGLEDAYLVGAPDRMLVGKIEDLWQPDAVIMDARGYRMLWPGEPLQTGKVFEMNDRRAVLVGICQVSQSFETFPIVYTTYSRAVRFNPPERKVLTFILAQPQEGRSAAAVARNIQQQTALKASTRNDFLWATIWYYLGETGIPINFGITVMLGFLVGTAIASQTLYLFTVENLKQFATLKAMGASNGRIVVMILLQALVVGLVGYGIGVGLAACFGMWAGNIDRLAFYMPPQVLVVTAVAVLAMVSLSGLLCIRRVLVLEPAMVFQD